MVVLMDPVSAAIRVTRQPDLWPAYQICSECDLYHSADGGTLPFIRV